jgi:broad specificity phosphatase PhoE
MKTRLIFVRHAEAEGNAKRRFQGWTDGELTEKGHIQAALAAKRLKDTDIDVIYSSSLRRTLQTAGYISKAKNLPIIRTDKLKEINGGAWENIRFDQLPVLWPHEYDTWENKPHIHKMPEGESMEEFQQRLIKEVEYIIKNNTGKNICVVTHGTAIKTLMCYFFGCKLEKMLDIDWYDNTSITIIEYEDEKYTVVTEGDASHLSEDLSTIQNQKWWAEYKDKQGERISTKD